MMRETHSVLDVIGYNAAISALGKGEQWQQALGLLFSMPKADLAITIFANSVLYGVRQKISPEKNCNFVA
jgi:pentatricopeptide repeat protein